jgi:hypothetical protein
MQPFLYRQQVKGKMALNQTETVMKEINIQRAKLERDLALFRKVQNLVTPLVQELVASIADDVEPENEPLFLPSAFPEGDRSSKQLDALGRVEIAL